MDQQLLFLINREWTCAPLDWFMAALSCLAAWLPWLIVAGLALLVLGNFRERAFVVTLLVVVAINDGIVSNSLKHLVDRPRPHQSHNAVTAPATGTLSRRLHSPSSQSASRNG